MLIFILWIALSQFNYITLLIEINLKIIYLLIKFV